MQLMPISLPKTILYLRISPNSSATHYNVFRIVGGREHKAERTIGDLVNAELLDKKHHASKQLHLQHPPRLLVPLFVVELLGEGQRFLLGSKNGITLWYGERLYKSHSKKPFPEALEPMHWAVNNLLVYLQRAYLCLPLQNPGLGYSSSSYPVNIFLSIGDNPDDPETKFTTLFVSGDTKLVDIFELLAKGGVGDWYKLFQWVWSKGKEKYEVPICWYYSDARERNVAFKDCGWVDDAIVWLRPQAE